MKPDSLALLLITGREPTAARIAPYLTSHGVRVTAVADRRAAEAEVGLRSYDCIVMDLGVCGDAIEVMRSLREATGVPILFVAATRDVDERVAVLDAGADDCIAAPMSDRELLQRILSSVRRARRFR